MGKKLVLVVAFVTVALAASATNINPWNTNFDSGRPSNATVFSSIDDEILDAKQSTRARMDVDHEFSSLNSTPAHQTNSGRHIPGSARAFLVSADTACSTITAMKNAALDGTGTAIPDGTICLDDDDLEICVYSSSAWVCNTPATDNVPTGAIFMFDAACPTGYTDISSSHTKNVLRVIDTAATDADIPDTPGTACTANGGECGAATTQYSDTLTANEIPAHTHDIAMSTTGSASNTNVPRGGSTTADTGATGSVGGGDPHYHPSSYFRLCKKN